MESDQQADRSTTRSRESLPLYGPSIFHLLRVWVPASGFLEPRALTDLRIVQQLASALLSAAMHFAGAYTHSYGALMTTRVFQAYVVP